MQAMELHGFPLAQVKKRLELSLPFLALGLGRAGPPLGHLARSVLAGLKKAAFLGWKTRFQNFFLLKETVPREQSVNDP